MNRKELIKFSVTMILLTIAIAISILLFCWMCYLLPYDFPGTVGEWITAFSALAGGALTLGGVWWTIKDQERKRKEDMSMLYRPILSCKPVSSSIYKSTKKFSFNKFDFECSIKNIGRGEAIIEKITFQTFSNIHDKFIELNDYAGIHPINTDIPIFLNLELPKTTEISKTSGKLIVLYSDLYKTQYTLIVTFIFTYTNDRILSIKHTNTYI